MNPSGYNMGVSEDRMPVQFILSQYLEKAMAEATYDKLEDGTFGGRIPTCTGVLAFGTTLRECERELRSALEDWVLMGLKLGHPLREGSAHKERTFPAEAT